jgi:divalent metal cation (Fe/Co/Zn/Cd) transporter
MRYLEVQLEIRHEPDEDADARVDLEVASTQSSRTSHLKTGACLAAVTFAWNLAEGIIAVSAGAAARSIALVAFGMDSFIETISAALVGWRLIRELRGDRDSLMTHIESRTSRVAGALLLLLATYIVIDAGMRLVGYGAEPRPSAIGMIVTAAALVVMPVLAWLKLRAARQLNSHALRADAFETIASAGLSAPTLGGLAVNFALGWKWADPLAALLLVPMIAREGFEAIGQGGADEDQA